RRAWRVSEAQGTQGRLLADRRAARAYGGERPLIVARHGERQAIVVLAGIAERARRLVFDRTGDARVTIMFAVMLRGVARARPFGHDLAGDGGRLADAAAAGAPHQIDVDVIVVINV